MEQYVCKYMFNVRILTNSLKEIEEMQKYLLILLGSTLFQFCLPVSLVALFLFSEWKV